MKSDKTAEDRPGIKAVVLRTLHFFAVFAYDERTTRGQQTANGQTCTESRQGTVTNRPRSSTRGIGLAAYRTSFCKQSDEQHNVNRHTRPFCIVTSSWFCAADEFDRSESLELGHQQRWQ